MTQQLPWATMKNPSVTKKNCSLLKKGNSEAKGEAMSEILDQMESIQIAENIAGKKVPASTDNRLFKKKECSNLDEILNPTECDLSFFNAATLQQVKKNFKENEEIVYCSR